MSDPTWSVISCPDCSAKFKAPTDLGEGESLACPACGHEIVNESEQDQPPAPAIIPEPAVSPVAVALQADRDDDPEDGSFLPPMLEKGVSLDLSGLAVRDTNRKPLESRSQGDDRKAPSLDNIGKLASTDDEAFIAIDEGPRQRVASKRVQKEIVGWDDNDTDGRKGSQSTVATTFKLTLLALPVLIGVGIFALKGRPNNRPRAAAEDHTDGTQPPLAPDGSVASPKLPSPPDPESVEFLRQELGDKRFVEAIKQKIEQFLSTKSIQDRSLHVRDRDRVRPLMENYYAKQPIGPIEVKEIAPQTRVRVERGFAVTNIVLPNLDSLPIVLARSGDEIVVDWESFVGYGEMSLDEFIAKKPTEPVLFRVRAKPDDYYNFDFNEKRHYCIALTDLNITQRIYGYFERGSEVADEVLSQMAKQQGLDFVIVKLRFPPNAKSDNQVIIDDFIETGWLMKDKK